MGSLLPGHTVMWEREGACRSSGLLSEDSQGPGKTGYFDGTVAERVRSDPQWVNQMPLCQAKSSLIGAQTLTKRRKLVTPVAKNLADKFEAVWYQSFRNSIYICVGWSGFKT